jgi:hypothetical protein
MKEKKSADSSEEKTKDKTSKASDYFDAELFHASPSKELELFADKYKKDIQACGLDISFKQIINRLFAFEKRPR